MNRNIKNNVIIVLFFTILIFISCEENIFVRNNDNIAIVGRRKIDWKHIQRSYELTPK